MRQRFGDVVKTLTLCHCDGELRLAAAWTMGALFGNRERNASGGGGDCLNHTRISAVCEAVYA